jgi:hypothetical protein
MGIAYVKHINNFNYDAVGRGVRRRLNMLKFLLLTIAFLFCGSWSLFFTQLVKNKPKTCWSMIALMSVLVYYLY